MDPVAPNPNPRHPVHGVSQSRPEPLSRPPEAGARPCPDRNGELPLAVPADLNDVPADLNDVPAAAQKFAVDLPRQALIAGLQARIGSIERRERQISLQGSKREPWTSGASAIDARLGGGGLDCGGVHEIKPGMDSNGNAALGFAWRLAVRFSGQQPQASQTPILWCTTDRSIGEMGRPHGPGLMRLGLDPQRLLLVEARRSIDVLWAIEEGLKSRVLVLAMLDEIDLVAARRLSLAAEANAVPVLLLTHPAHAPAASTASRWRVSSLPSADHSFDSRAPGAPRFRVQIERCRNRPLACEGQPHVLEWSDETRRFRMVPGVVDRAHAPSKSDERKWRRLPSGLGAGR